MKLRSILAGALVLALSASLAFAQTNPGSSPLTIAKGGTAAATASAARTSLGLAIGSNVEAWDTDLDCLAALSSTGILRRTGSGTCSNGTVVSILEGGTGQTTKQPAFNALAPTPTRAGDITYWNGTNYVNLAGNNSGTQFLQENASGVPSWVTVSGTGTVTSVVVAPGGGISVSGTCTITTSGTCTVANTAIRGHISALTLSTAGSSSTFGVSAGTAADSTSVSMMALGSAYTKTTSAWALGTAAGSLDTGSIANSTWYHVFLIQRPDTGVVDVLTSLSPTAPTLPTNYTLFRRIGSMKTNGSAQWILFSQNGDEFLWDAGLSDVASVTNPGTTAVLRTLTVPTGIQVRALFNAIYFDSSGTAGAFLVTSPDESDAAVGTGNFTFRGVGSSLSGGSGSLDIRTNTSAQVRTKVDHTSANVTIGIYTRGWLDRRGRDS